MSGNSQTAILVAIGVVVVAGIGGTVVAPSSSVLILGFCGVITTTLLNMLTQAKSSEQQKVATEAVASKLEVTTEAQKTSTAAAVKKIDAIAEVADKTHTLVNSNMGAQLKIAAVALRRVAELTAGKPDHAADVKVAEEAERLLAEHESKQAKVDASAATPPAGPTAGPAENPGKMKVVVEGEVLPKPK